MNRFNFINLDFREDRFNHIMSEIHKQGITDYKKFDGIHDKHFPKKGILQAHKSVVREAKENGWQSVIVAEDDLRFFAPGAWQYFLDNTPDDYDIYFAMIYVGDVDSDNRIISTCSGMTMYRVHERFYDIFLSIPEHDGGVHIDRYITSMHDKYKFFVCDKYVCEQIGGTSDNTKKKNNDYTPLLKGKPLFTG